MSSLNIGKKVKLFPSAMACWTEADKSKHLKNPIGVISEYHCSLGLSYYNVKFDYTPYLNDSMYLHVMAKGDR